MSQNIKLFISFFILSLPTLFAQDKMTLSGTITDALNNETLIGVTIIIPELGTGTTTNEYGFYSISIPEGEYTIEISYVGFDPISETILLNENIRRNFSLNESSQQLEEIILTDQTVRTEIRRPEMSVNKLSIKEIKEHSLLKLKKKRYLYMVDKTNFLPFENDENKYFSQSPILIKGKEKIENVYDYLKIT